MNTPADILEPFIESPAAEARAEERAEMEVFDGPPSAEAKEAVRVNRAARKAAEARKKAEADRTFDLAKGAKFSLRLRGASVVFRLMNASRTSIGWEVFGHGKIELAVRSGEQLSVGACGIIASITATSTPSGATVSLVTDAEIVR